MADVAAIDIGEVDDRRTTSREHAPATTYSGAEAAAKNATSGPRYHPVASPAIATSGP